MRAAAWRALCLGGLLALEGHAAQPQRWSQGRSAHFRFFTDGQEQATRTRARSFEILYEILKVITPDLRRGRAPAPSPWPSNVYLFETEKGLKPYHTQRSIHGFSVKHLDGDYIATRTGRARNAFSAPLRITRTPSTGTCAPT